MALLSSKVGSIDDNGSGGSYAYRASKSRFQKYEVISNIIDDLPVVKVVARHLSTESHSHHLLMQSSYIVVIHLHYKVH